MMLDKPNELNRLLLAFLEREISELHASRGAPTAAREPARSSQFLKSAHECRAAAYAACGRRLH